ncbi:MAG: hypothetical protein ABIH76_01065 [Candidatus Bathyarchaeota archaeon]
MSHAEICPVCNGKGFIQEGILIPHKKICHGCNGRGWITIQDPNPIYNPQFYKKEEP